MRKMVPSGVRLGIVRSISYGLFGKPDEFVPELRELGATLVRVYFYWSQIEPDPGNYTFEVVDAFLDQLNGSEEVWVTVCSSSQWATEQATDFLPPSPAKDLEAYDRFERQLVQHCAGRVHYWQCDNEPSNVGLTWAGTADSYATQLRVMHSAVKETDSRAAVVLGGAPYALPSSTPDSPERQFFDVVLREGREFFDLFDLHLYGQADLILPDIEAARGMMRAFGYEKPLVVGEYNAPWPNLYPEATVAMEQAMAAAFATAAATGGDSDGQNAIGDAVAPQRSPEEIAMESLYEQMASLPLHSLPVAALLLYFPACSATEAIRPGGRHLALITRSPGPHAATGQRNDRHRAVLPVVRSPYQEGALSDPGHKAESVTEMIIGCRASSCRVVGDLGAKIIKREDLHLSRVGCGGILIRRGHRESSLRVTQPRRGQSYASPELIVRCGRSGNACGVLSQPSARRNGGASRGEELHAAGIGRGSNVLGRDSHR
jgi:hypothetical protein